MSIEVYKEGFENAKWLISEGHFVDDKGNWDEINPGTQEEDAFIREHGVAAYAKWHLGVKEGGSREDKTTYSFPYGDFKNVHRSALMAAEERAKQYSHFAIRDAAVELISQLDEAAK